MADYELSEILQISDKVVIITWSDGHEGLYFADHLRKNCPCAACENKTEQSSTPPFKIYGQDQKEISFTGWARIGRYAVEFHFSDGHTTGIYPYKLLRELCQCDVCTGNAIQIQGPVK
ncbi:MAG TPA: DUF971 domain-containing protein [Calditrichaeota bacterium]|nr:DUF971 domain-containing protein [Calditrichota bacterium]